MGLKNTWDTFAGSMQRDGNKTRCSKIHGTRFIHRSYNLILREGNEQTLIFTELSHIDYETQEKIVQLYRKENSIVEWMVQLLNFPIFKRAINRLFSGITFTFISRVLSCFIRDGEKLSFKHPLLVYPNSSSLI